MIKVANFIIDEKFIDWQIQYHDLTNETCQHDYFFVGNKTYKFVKQSAQRIKKIKKEEVLNVVLDYDAVFLHSLFGMPIDLIPKIDRKIKVFWFAWGYDIYNNPEPRPLVNINLYHPATKRYMRGDIKGLFFNTLMQIRGCLKKRGRKYYLKAVNRIDYFSGVIPEEYYIVKQECPCFRAKPVNYSYCNISRFSNNEMDDIKIQVGENIILGNSTAYTNNHLDILNDMKSLEIGKRKIFAPLSYYPNQRYVNRIKKEGRRLFRDSFVALTDFLPIDEYNKIVKSCGFSILGVERQQGYGVLLSSLFIGSKVFLFESSILYRHCQNLGLKVFTIEKDLISNNVFVPLTCEEALNNRRIINARSTKDYMLKKLYDIYDLILSNDK